MAMILLIDDQISNLVILEYQLKKLNLNITYSKYFKEEYLNMPWELIILDINSDDHGENGLLLKERILTKRIDLIGKIFVTSADSPNLEIQDFFVERQNIFNFILNNFKKTLDIK